MTPQEIINAVRRRYNAVGDNYFSDAMLLDEIYLASQQIALETECIKKRYTASTVADQREYSKPTNCYRIERIEVDGVRLDHHDFVEDDTYTGNDSDTTASGDPTFYSEYGDTIFLRPIPDASGDTITIFSIDMPDTVTISSTLDIPSRYHYAIIEAVLESMFGKDQNYQMADYHQRRFERYLQMTKEQEFMLQFGERYKTVKPEEAVSWHDEDII
jgi:hypothetical protein